MAESLASISLQTVNIYNASSVQVGDQNAAQLGDLTHRESSSSDEDEPVHSQDRRRRPKKAKSSEAREDAAFLMKPVGKDR